MANDAENAVLQALANSDLRRDLAFMSPNALDRVCDLAKQQEQLGFQMIEIIIAEAKRCNSDKIDLARFGFFRDAAATGMELSEIARLELDERQG